MARQTPLLAIQRRFIQNRPVHLFGSHFHVAIDRYAPRHGGVFDIVG
jgi:hypothetical protein